MGWLLADELLATLKPKMSIRLPNALSCILLEIFVRQHHDSIAIHAALVGKIYRGGGSEQNKVHVSIEGLLEGSIIRMIGPVDVVKDVGGKPDLIFTISVVDRDAGHAIKARNLFACQPRYRRSEPDTGAATVF